MARLQTVGFEWGDVNAEGTGLGSGVALAATAGVGRSGSYGLQAGASGVSFIRVSGLVLARTYFLRGYFKKSADVASNIYIMGVNTDGSTRQVRVRLNSSDQSIQLEAPGTTVIGSTSSPLNNDQWYRIELSWQTNSGSGDDQAELLLDGASVASTTTATFGTIAAAGYELTGQAGPPAMTWDDVALNDDQGADQNSWPGEGSIVLCKPISQNQRGSWTGGAGGTGDLTTAIDNVPPVGTASETDSTQIESTDSSGGNATDEYRSNLTTYTDAGIGASDTITLVHPMVNHGEDVSTGTKTGDVYMQANPAGSAGTGVFTFGDNVGALGTWPSNWRNFYGAPIYAPSVTKSSSPVVALRKTDTGTRVASVDALGAYVEYVPAVSGGEDPMPYIGGGYFG